MIKFLCKLGFVYLVFTSTLLSLELMLLSKPNLYSHKQEYMDSHLDDISLFIIGQSHFEEGINPTYLRDDSIYNFAISGQGLIYTEQLARKYIPRMKNLKVVFVPFSYGMGYRVKNKTQGKFESTYRCMYLKYMHLHTNRLTDWMYWSEFANSKLNIIERLYGKPDQCLCGLSYEKLDSLKGHIPLKLKGRIKEWETDHLPNEFDFTAPNDDYYHQINTIANLCQERGIRLILISIPWWHSAHAKMTKRGIAAMQKVTDELHKKYPCLEYHNYVFDKRFTADDFNDATHLNEFGSSKFSLILKNDLHL